MRIHFFHSREETPEDSFLSWNPDLEPWRYSSGFGHNILELASRLKTIGHEVSHGSEVPSRTEAVIFFKKHFLLRRNLSPSVFKIAMKYPVILIRSDLPIENRLIFEPDLEIMPNQSLVTRANQVFIPPIPQRGLIARDANRLNRLTNLAIKCNPENIPSSTDFILAQLRAIDEKFALVIDSPKISDGSDNNWNDFSQVDISLILRPFTSVSNDRKPPTRLINAWAAGTIPFVDPIPAYLELVRDGIDGFIIDSPEDVASVVSILVEDPIYRAQVFANAKKRGEEYDVNRVVGEWEQTINELCCETRLSLRRSFLLFLQFTKTLIWK